MSKSDPDFWRDGDPTGEGAPDSEVSDDYAAKYLRKPPKRASIIVTDADCLRVAYHDGTRHLFRRRHEPSEQLLADLRIAEYLLEVGGFSAVAARLRALLPKEEEDGG